MGRQRKGFTLQAPRLVAVALVVLLAAIATPTLRANLAKQREWARLKMELRRLDSLETRHFARYGFYTPNAGRTDARAFIPFLPTPGLQVILMRADSVGWAAGVRSDADAVPYDWHGCAIFAGPAAYAPDRRVTTPHEPACW
jgi:hypothetical protein